MPHDDVFPLREALAVTSGGATLEEVRTEQVEPGWHWLVTHYAVEDETTVLTSIRAYVESGGLPYFLSEQLVPGAGVLFDGETRQILGDGDRFGARFNGSTSGDNLRLYVHGWRFPPGVRMTAALVAQLVGVSEPHQSAHPVEPEG